MNDMASGYYWASFDEGSKWEVADWDSELNWWMHVGTDVPTDEGMGFQIHLDDVWVGPRIEPLDANTLGRIAASKGERT